jgi:hypothetical protein
VQVGGSTMAAVTASGGFSSDTSLDVLQPIMPRLDLGKTTAHVFGSCGRGNAYR